MGWQVTASEYSPLLAPQDNTIFAMTKLYNPKHSSNSSNCFGQILVTRSQKSWCCPSVAKLLSRCCPDGAALPHPSLSLCSQNEEAMSKQKPGRLQCQPSLVSSATTGKTVEQTLTVQTSVFLSCLHLAEKSLGKHSCNPLKIPEKTQRESWSERDA